MWRAQGGPKHTHRAIFPQLSHDLLHDLLLDVVFDRHTHMHLARADQVDDDAEAVQHAENACQEAVRHALAITVQVQHDDIFFDGYCRGELEMQVFALSTVQCTRDECRQRLVRRPMRLRGRCRVDIRVRMDHCTAAQRILYILDANRNPFANNLHIRRHSGCAAPSADLRDENGHRMRKLDTNLLHRERVHDLAAVVRQLRRLLRADDGPIGSKGCV